jgi:hypothetical protein
MILFWKLLNNKLVSILIIINHKNEWIKIFPNHVSIIKIETLFLESHVLSTFDYYLKNENKISLYSKQSILSIIDFLICLLGITRVSFGAFITDPSIWGLIGDPFYLIGNWIWIHSAIISLGFMGLMHIVLYFR